MAETRTAIMADSAKMQLARLVSRALITVTGIVVANVLGPELLGELTIPMLVITYSAFFNLGLIEGLTREIPILNGKNRSEELLELKQVSQSTTTILVLLVLAVFYGIRYLYPTFVTTDNLLFHYTATGILVTSILRFCYLVAICERKFSAIFPMLYFQGAVRLTVVLTLLFILTAQNKLYAQPTGLLASLIVSSLFLWRSIRFPLRINLSLPAIRILLSSGVMVAFYALLLGVLGTGDTLILKSVLAKTHLGYYQIGNLIRDTLIMLSSSVAAVALPTYGVLYGSTSNRRSLMRKVNTHMFYMGMLIPVLIGAGVFMLKPVVHVLLPEYDPGITQLQLLVFSMAPFMMVTIPAAFLIILNKQSRLIILMLLTLVFLAVGNKLLVPDMSNVQLSPYINFIGYLGLAVVLVCYTQFHFNKTPGAILGALIYLVPITVNSVYLGYALRTWINQSTLLLLSSFLGWLALNAAIVWLYHIFRHQSVQLIDLKSIFIRRSR